MEAKPEKEHEWLQRLVGNWTYENECFMGPDQPLVKHSGKESVRLIGGFWALCEGVGDMPGGGQATMIISIGYDPAKKKYIGSFIGSMMAGMWIYEGDLDASGNVLTLNTEGPGMMDPAKTSKYKDVIEFKDEDHRVLSSHVLGDDGKWFSFMTAHYRRTK